MWNGSGMMVWMAIGSWSGLVGCCADRHWLTGSASLCDGGTMDASSDFCTTLEEWRAAAEPDDKTGQCPVYFLHVVGECQDGAVRFLFRRGAYTTTTLYYAADSGEYLCMVRTTDIDEPVGRRGCEIECEDATVIEMICPANGDPGEPINLP